MKVKFCIGMGIIGGLSLVGCMNGIYSSSVSVKKNNNGVKDYTIVESLDTAEIGSSMPVVVEGKSVTDRVGLGGTSGMLWLFSLGVIPGMESGETVGHLTIKTPLGEKTGSYKIEAKGWAGWLPIFLPYPGLADGRVWGTSARLPNESLESEVSNKLLANLVSQFSKEEYASFIAKNNSPERKAQRAKEAAERERLAKERAEAERVRLAKEAAERAEKMRLAARTTLYERTVENDLAAIKKCYSEGKRYENPFFGKQRRNRNETTDWLAKWASPRLNISDADALAGEGLLSEFGTKYLPNAYANYEKKRDALIELQQVFNEEFPQPWTIKESNSKWGVFNKVLEKFVKARTEYFICHDELCHYWHLYRFGVYTAEDFAKIDGMSLSVRLRMDKVKLEKYTSAMVNPLEEKIITFAAKYAPDSNAVYADMARELNQLNALLKEVFAERIKMDCVRGSAALDAALQKRNLIVGQMNALAKIIETWYYSHRIMDKTSEDVAKCDFETAKNLKSFMLSLGAYIKENSTVIGGDIIKGADMIPIPNRKYKLQRTEVTQEQWEMVMGNNPSEFKDPKRPVENVSWDDCQKFIKRLNEIEWMEYRLPTEEEWEYACRAGSTGGWGKRRGGEDGSLDVMGWYNQNAYNTQCVAQKEPNAFGLYDMHGNVAEWCQDTDDKGYTRVCRGGSWRRDEGWCTAFYSPKYYSVVRSGEVGLRLAISQD